MLIMIFWNDVIFLDEDVKIVYKFLLCYEGIYIVNGVVVKFKEEDLEYKYSCYFFSLWIGIMFKLIILMISND